MIKHILFALAGICPLVVRADLILQQQSVDTNGTHVLTMKLHADKMRLDSSDSPMVAIVDLTTHDSLTLVTTNQTYLELYGAILQKKLAQEKQETRGTNDMDQPPAPATATGKTETVNGYDTEIYQWSGALGIKQTLWVAKNFPNFEAIRWELAKLDLFNDTGPHRNAQPVLSRLPGMVIKSEASLQGRSATTTLVTVQVEPVDPGIYQLPPGYTHWKRPEPNPQPQPHP